MLLAFLRFGDPDRIGSMTPQKARKELEGLGNEKLRARNTRMFPGSCMALLLAMLPAGCTLPQHAGAETKPSTMSDADVLLRQQMSDRWASPERRTWRIEYRSIDGTEGDESWHVADTLFWVRIHPEVFRLEELDKDSAYEIDAVALDQNYGVIDFYLYSFPEKVQEGIR